ncbi:hypothetical protein LAB1_25610 [Roseibium sp. LAB1]
MNTLRNVAAQICSENCFENCTGENYLKGQIAAEAFVGPGVRVGEGAVLGARAVTVKDLAPWTVYAGNPAKPLKERQRFERTDVPKRGWREPLDSEG